MSVGLLAVHLLYGFYALVLMFNFYPPVQWLHCRLTLAGNSAIDVVKIKNVISKKPRSTIGVISILGAGWVFLLEPFDCVVSTCSIAVVCYYDESLSVFHKHPVLSSQFCNFQYENHCCSN